jgi:hypothetical protein
MEGAGVVTNSAKEGIRDHVPHGEAKDSDASNSQDPAKLRQRTFELRNVLEHAHADKRFEAAIVERNFKQ